MKCAVLILNYNGQKHLEECIPSVLEAASRVDGGCPVVVVDNRSTDDSLEWLRRTYPQVEIEIAEKNNYLFSLNPIVKSRSEDVVVLLNNDMHFDPDFIVNMTPPFNDSSVFAVTGEILDWEGVSITTGRRIGEIRHFWFYKHWEKSKTRCFTLDAGNAAFRRTMFVELGGFDPLYHPAYYEDIDLSYRAWKRGWKVVYEPASILYHRESGTWNSTQGGNSAVSELICRNHIVFTFRNVGGWGFVCCCLFLLPLRIIRNALDGNHAVWKGILKALPRIPAALICRMRDMVLTQRKDADFLNEIAQSRQPD